MAIFKKIKDIIQGAPSQSGYEDADKEAFIADSFSFQVEREMKESGEKGGTEDINIGVGGLQEASSSKAMDPASPALSETAEDEPATDYLKFKMENTLVTSWSTAGSPDEETPVEDFALDYEKVKFEYSEQDEPGAGEPAHDDWEADSGDAAATSHDKWSDLATFGQSLHPPGSGAAVGDGSGEADELVQKVQPETAHEFYIKTEGATQGPSQEGGAPAGDADQLSATPEEPAAPAAQGDHDTNELEHVSFTYRKVEVGQDGAPDDLTGDPGDPEAYGDITLKKGYIDNSPLWPTQAADDDADEAAAPPEEPANDLPEGEDFASEGSEFGSAAGGLKTIVSAQTDYNPSTDDDDAPNSLIADIGQTKSGEMSPLGTGPGTDPDDVGFDGIDGEASDELDL